MIKLYGVPTCQQIRKTKALLEELGVEYIFVNVKKTPVSESFLREVVKQLGLETVVNKKGTTYRKLGLKDKNLSDEELFQVLLEQQSMIKRPLIEKEGRSWIGYDPEGIENFIKN